MAEKVAVAAKKLESEKKCSSSCKRKPSFDSSGSLADRILYLQRTAGNQAVQRLIKSGSLQAKLRIGQPNDIYEQEADRVADQVMRMPDPAIQRRCANCEKEKEKVLQTKESPGQMPKNQEHNMPSSVNEALLSSGQPLDSFTRAYMEPRFGQDFSYVRVHTDEKAAKSAKQMDALAYTVGKDVVFGTGMYSPKRSDSQKLLAHELVHTIQQQRASNEVLQREDDGSGGSEVSSESPPISESETQLGGTSESQTPKDNSNELSLDQKYRKAIAEGDWQASAESLNGFADYDIRNRLSQLTPAQIANIHQGALDNPLVGPNSQVAQLTNPSTSNTTDTNDTENVCKPPTEFDSQNQCIDPNATRTSANSSVSSEANTNDTENVCKSPDDAPPQTQCIDPNSVKTPADLAILDHDYYAAVETSNWQIAAEKLNAFADYDIKNRLSQLTDYQMQKMHQGALDNPSVGPNSQLAKLTSSESPLNSILLTTEFQDQMIKNPELAKAYTPIYGPTGIFIGYSRLSGGYSEIRNTEGEIVWSDEIPLEHGLPIIDPALDLVENGLTQLGYVALGTVDTVLENNWRALGLPVDDKKSIANKLGIPLGATAYTIGRGAGHIVTLLQTAAELVGGVTMFTSGIGEFMAGVATTPEGIGVVIIPVAMVTVAGGATIVMHGGALGKATFINMMKAEGRSKSNRREFEPPDRDGTGKVHSENPGENIPQNGAEIKRALDSWTREEMEIAAKELEGSIAARQAEQIRLGETNVGTEGQRIGAAHRVRIGKELALLRAILKRLSGS